MRTCYRINPLGSPDIVTETNPFLRGLSVVDLSLPVTSINCGSQCQSLVKRKGTIYSKVIQVVVVEVCHH